MNQDAGHLRGYRGPQWTDSPAAISWRRRMPAGEHHFGLGERAGPLDKRGRRHSFWCTDQLEHGPGTDARYLAIPFSLAMDADGRCHGRLLNNTHRSEIDLTDELGERLVVRVAGGELDEYVFAGPSPARVLARYTGLTGRTPLPPRWALGYHHARWGYAGTDLLAAAHRLRAESIPTDVLYVDVENQHPCATGRRRTPSRGGSNCHRIRPTVPARSAPPTPRSTTSTAICRTWPRSPRSPRPIRTSAVSC